MTQMFSETQDCGNLMSSHDAWIDICNIQFQFSFNSQLQKENILHKKILTGDLAFTAARRDIVISER